MFSKYFRNKKKHYKNSFKHLFKKQLNFQEFSICLNNQINKTNALKTREILNKKGKTLKEYLIYLFPATKTK